MPITQVLSLQEKYLDQTKIKVKDITTYGISAPDRRQDAARVMFAAKIDKNSVLTYATDLDNTNPLTDLDWIFNYIGDSPYRFMYFNVPLWSNAPSYQIEVITDEVISQFADIVYHADSNSYYKCIQPNNSIQPTVTASWENYWVVYNFTTLPLYINSNRLTVLIYDALVAYAYQSCIIKKVNKMSEKQLCGVCTDSEDFMNVLRMQFLLDSIESLVWQQQAAQAAYTLEEASKKFCSC